MSDLNESELDYYAGDRLADALGKQELGDLASMVAEIRRHRAAHRADAARIAEVVREAFCSVDGLAGHPDAERLATRVAKQLAAPVLSEEEREELLRLRAKEWDALTAICHLDKYIAEQCGRTIALLDRLLGGGK